MISARLESNDIGIYLVNITMQDAEPPTEEVKQAFKAVETAKQGKETALNNANKYKNEKIPEAEANVDKILQDAEATKQDRINEANGQVARFNKLYEEYAKYPEVTKQRMFYETMEEILPSLKVVINSSNGNVQTILPIDSLATINTSSQASDTGSQASQSTDN
jgi:membrane protease subunit HflK